MPPCLWPDETSSTVPFMLQAGMDATPSPMAALANPPVGVVSKSPLLSNPTMQNEFQLSAIE